MRVVWCVWNCKNGVVDVRWYVVECCNELCEYLCVCVVICFWLYNECDNWWSMWGDRCSWLDCDMSIFVGLGCVVNSIFGLCYVVWLMVYYVGKVLW